jgi:hypothetical protein
MKKSDLAYFSSNSKKETIGYIPKFPKCPYLSTSGNKCSRKRVGKICIYSKKVEKCPYYKEWIKQRKIDSGCVESDLNDIQGLNNVI